MVGAALYPNPKTKSTSLVSRLWPLSGIWTNLVTVVPVFSKHGDVQQI